MRVEEFPRCNILDLSKINARMFSVPGLLCQVCFQWILSRHPQLILQKKLMLKLHVVLRADNVTDPEPDIQRPIVALTVKLELELDLELG
jgi:hypothetical protein